MLSNDPKLKLERIIVFGALGLYLFRHMQLQTKGQLAGEDSLAINVNKEKVFDAAQNHFNMTPAQRKTLEGIYDHFTEKKES